MTCQPIQGLKLDERSRDALKDLSDRRQIGKILNYLLPAAVTLNALSSNKALATSYNISATDYESVAIGMKGLPRTYKNRVEVKSEFMIMTYYNQPKTPEERKLRQFWSNMAYHCKMESEAE